jgi:phage tail tape-measure protein
MYAKKFIWLGVFVGSTLGGFVPALWGGSLFSCSSVVFSFLGGLLGIWLGMKVSEFLG